MHTAVRLCWAAVAALLALPLAAQQPPGIDVPYVTTPPEVVAQMLALARPTRNDVLYDLGSGDGRIVIEAARRFGTRGLGVDIDPVRVEEATDNARRRGVQDRVRFRRQDLFATDLRPASIVTLYLLPNLNLELRPKLFEQLRPGTRVVSHAFHMGDWAPDTVVAVRVNQGVGRAMVYAWTIPAQIAGRWTLTTPEGRRVTLQLRQQYQRFTGPGVSGRLVGDRIDITLTERVNGRPLTRRLSGRVTGDGMSGSVAGGGAWRAMRAPAIRSATSTAPR
ncbi:methyltransferase domain-containing protein [Longimicrobium terrae]|uniref:Protein-L-isoaspartate O-methyltransferase n=1 Tax=Longimicrobium terrae TaxID=1639882 RepID=A0A841H5T1_9BACT|nr:protein-L-isoaspartate O-methyltransferase [Longimicrobium terrae]MBB6073491.1 protein-L-isoaspartate O-methyltransferase [Longimicrobium terrae]